MRAFHKEDMMGTCDKGMAKAAASGEKNNFKSGKGNKGQTILQGPAAGGGDKGNKAKKGAFLKP